jgi:hypothetical protein
VDVYLIIRLCDGLPVESQKKQLRHLYIIEIGVEAFTVVGRLRRVDSARCYSFSIVSFEKLAGLW